MNASFSSLQELIKKSVVLYEGILILLPSTLKLVRCTIVWKKLSHFRTSGKCITFASLYGKVSFLHFSMEMHYFLAPG